MAKNKDITYEDWIKINQSILSSYRESIDEKKLFTFPSDFFLDQFYFWLFCVKNKNLVFYHEPWYTGAVKLEPDRYLTNWGRANLINVLCRYELWWNTNYSNRYDYFLKFYNTEEDRPFSFSVYQTKYFKNEFDFNQATVGLKRSYDWFMSHVVRFDIKLILRDCENDCRVDLGIPKIGEGWVSETALYYFVKTLLPEYEVIQHGSPNFLGRQHYDVFIPDFLIALEYQGIQHAKPVDYFGGEGSFIQNQERDKRKKKLSKENGVTLIEVYPDYSESKLGAHLKRTITRKKNIQVKKDNN